jgi:uncharacterized Zn finger protein
MAREEVAGLLSPAPPRGASRRAGVPLHDEGEAPPAEPLRSDVGAFWAGGELAADPFGEVEVPATAAALVRRLGRFPFWRGARSLLEAVEPLYVQASSRGLDVFLASARGSEAS